MTVREMLELLTNYASDARAADNAILVRCDGSLRIIATAETRLIHDGDQRPRDTILLVIADGPANVSEVSPTTLRPSLD